MRHPLLISLALACITLVTYMPSLQYVFHFDDHEHIVKYFAIRTDTFSQLIFSSPRWLSRWLNAIYYSIGRHEPFIYRMAGITFHIITGLLLFGLIYSLCNQQNTQTSVKRFALLIATITSALFLLHPLQTQTVSYVIQGQLEGLSTLALICSVFTYIAYARSKKYITRLLTLVSLFFVIIIGCGTKEIFIVAPALLLLIDWFFLAEGSAKELIKRSWVVGIATFIIASFFYYYKTLKVFNLAAQAQNNFGNALTTNDSTIISRYDFFISQFKVILHYLSLFIWPMPMSVDYDYTLSTSFFAFDSFIPFLFLLILMTYSGYLLYRNKTNRISFGLLWFFIYIAPRTSIIPSSELVADYKIYGGSIGIFFIFALLIAFVFEKLEQWGEHAGISLMFLITCGSAILAYGTYTRNKVWQTEESFWADIIAKAPHKARGYNNYGVSLQNSGEYDKSLHYLRQAIALDSRYPDPLINSAVSCQKLGDIDQAIEYLEKALMINKFQPETYVNYGQALIHKGEYERAEKALLQAIKLRPYSGKAWHNLASARLFSNDHEGALEAARTASTQSDYQDIVSFRLWAQSAFTLKKYDEAITACTVLLERFPNETQAIILRAQCSVQIEHYAQALFDYTQLTILQPDNPVYWYNKGECCLRLHNYHNALAAYEEALRYLPTFQKAEYKKACCYVQLHDYVKAETICKTLLAQYPPRELREEIASLMKGLD